MAKSIGRDKSKTKESLNPEKYGMLACPDCKSKGYVGYPKRRCCPKCGGFGFIKKEKGASDNEVKKD
jgi:uncharacterized OB-fold protein